MEERVKYEVGDIVKLKKPHPCGSREWKILRVGADFRLECLGCGHQVMMARPLVEKSARGLRKPEIVKNPLISRKISGIIVTRDNHKSLLLY